MQCGRSIDLLLKRLDSKDSAICFRNCRIGLRKNLIQALSFRKLLLQFLRLHPKLLVAKTRNHLCLRSDRFSDLFQLSIAHGLEISVIVKEWK